MKETAATILSNYCHSHNFKEHLPTFIKILSSPKNTEIVEDILQILDQILHEVDIETRDVAIAAGIFPALTQIVSFFFFSHQFIHNVIYF